MGLEMDAAARRVRNNIRAQNYPHAPLSPETLKDKQDPRILIEEGDYVNSIEGIQLSPRIWGVGVREPGENAEKAKTHEYGSADGKIPSRPHLRVEIERIRVGRLPSIRVGIARVLAGKKG